MARRLTSRFLTALDLSTATLGDVARGIGRAYRSIQAYKRGEVEVTPAVARALAKYLRRRSRELERAAVELESSAQKEER